jgi:hypothetical protein
MKPRPNAPEQASIDAIRSGIDTGRERSELPSSVELHHNSDQHPCCHDEPFGLMHQWANPGAGPLTFLAFNINTEGVPAVPPGAPAKSP